MTISNGVVKMLNITPPANSTVDRIVDMAPDIVDKIQGIVDKFKE